MGGLREEVLNLGAEGLRDLGDPGRHRRLALTVLDGDDQDHPHACYEGVVYIGHLVESEGS